MTRKEEIEKASIKYQMSIFPVAVGGDAFAEDMEILNINPSFVAGALYADKTMIEKACIWLKHNAKDFTYISAHSGDAKINEYKLIEEFEKAMEE